ncbi:TPA: hypothetical protein N0F65_002385 [Lagenidium giganteum]|uniref:Calx-beta domain-containing protein n=1 Tax=Lagenidium giganteum TaxID=4803 RepID=A0AAV2YL97_9STRA|nr:TPA: hypothetical protein N0F65_002385 [Lagenidium giganteum]
MRQLLAAQTASGSSLTRAASLAAGTLHGGSSSFSSFSSSSAAAAGGGRMSSNSSSARPSGGLFVDTHGGQGLTSMATAASSDPLTPRSRRALESMDSKRHDGGDSNPLSPRSCVLNMIDSVGSDLHAGNASSSAASSFIGRSMSMYETGSSRLAHSSASVTFLESGAAENRMQSGAEILYQAPIRVRLNNHRCLRISMGQLASTDFLRDHRDAGPSKKSRASDAPQITVHGTGLSGDDHQIFVLVNSNMRTDHGPVRYSDVVSLYCVAGSCKGYFLSTGQGAPKLTIAKGPVISAGEKWLLVNPSAVNDPDGDIDMPGADDVSRKLVNSSKRMKEQQKVIHTSGKVMLKAHSADLYLSVVQDPRDHNCYVKLDSENDGLQHNSLQVWELTKSNIPYDPSWNREREYLTGEVPLRPELTKRDRKGADSNLPPLSSYPPSIQEAIVLDDLLYSFIGIAGRYVRLSGSEVRSTKIFKFELNEYAMDPSILALATRCFPLGEHYLKLVRYVEQYSRYEYGQVSHAFCAALKSLIKEYTVVVAQLEHQMKSDEGLTIQKLWFYVQPSLRTMEMLSKLVDACETTSGGGSLLSEIQRIKSSLAGDLKACQVFSFLMERATVPYLKMVERWIYYGDLVDPYDEFMVRRDDKISKEELSQNPYSTYWDNRYTLREAQIPLFLARLASKILAAGKYLNVFRTCSRQVDCPFAGTISYATSESAYEELIDRAHAYASQMLLDLFLKEHDLSNRLVSLKHYFLMDQGDFFVDFMDVAEEELKMSADKLSLPRLESLLHLSLQTSTCSSDPYKDDLFCFLSPQNLIAQMEAIHERAKKQPHDSLTRSMMSSVNRPGYKVIDAFTLNYKVLWPLSLVISCGALTKYQMIFRHLFFCKHVERRLCDAWLNHQATKELSLRAALGPSFCLRQRMLHFQQNFVYYMMFEVISPRWHDFQGELASVRTVDEILEHHVHFLDMCLKECLLTDPELLRVLTKLMTVCMSFADTIERFTKPYMLDEETIKAEREAERDRRADKKAREEAEAALALHGRLAGQKKPVILKRRPSSTVDMRRARIKELSNDVERQLTKGESENPFVRRTSDLENQFDSLLAEFMKQLLRRSLLQNNSHLSNFYLADRAQAKKLIVLVQPVTSIAGEPLALQPVVALTDDSGNILTTENGGSVGATIGQAPSRFATVQPTTNSFAIVNGIAKCTGLYINLAGTGYSIVLQSIYHGVRTETATFDIQVGAPYQLAIYTDVSTAFGGSLLLPQPSVVVVDKGGNLVPSLSSGTVRVQIKQNPSNGHLLPAANTLVSIGSGIAKFQGLLIDNAGSPYTLLYTTDLVLPGGSSVETNPFTVAAGACTALVLTTTMVDAVGGKAFSVQPVVKMIDAGGNTLVQDSTSQIHVSIASNPSSGTLLPSTSLVSSVRQGVAIFRSLRIDKAGNDYTLAFRLYQPSSTVNLYVVTAIELVSPSFNVVVGRPVTLHASKVLSDGILDGQPNGVQPLLEIWDSGSNVVSSISTGVITATMISSPSIISAIVIDTTGAPTVTVVEARALPTPGYPTPYGEGMRIQIQVTFSDDVYVTGVPTLSLATTPGGAIGVAQCITATTWGTAVVFQYDIAAGDSATDLNYVDTTSLGLGNGAIIDRNSRPPDLTLPALASTSSLAGTSAVTIDTTPPFISAVTCTSPGDGSYGAGEQLAIQVKFSRMVSIYTGPYILMALTTIGAGSLTRTATYVSGNNTDTLVFQYVVQNGDAAADLDVTSDINLNGGFIKRHSTRPTTNVDVTMVTAPNNLASLQAIVIDTTVPSVDATIGVSSTSPNAVYAPGDTVTIVVPFTRPVMVTGFPRIFLETGVIKRSAGYKSGSGTTSLTFAYTVSPNDNHGLTGNANLNYRDDAAIDLNGGTIRRLLASGTVSADAVLSLSAVTAAGESLMDNAAIKIDGQPPTVQALSITSPVAGSTVTAGGQVTISISFTSLVTVNSTGGIPSLSLSVGSYDRKAYYQSGSGSLALLFLYTVSLGDSAPGGLDYTTINALKLNGGTIKRASAIPTLDADLTLPAPTLAMANPVVVIDRAAGSVTTITALTADVVAGKYGSNQVITLSLTFSDEVAVDGIPTLILNTNSLTALPYVTGSLTKELDFVYIVKDGDYSASLDVADANSFVCVAPACKLVNFNNLAVSTTLTGITLNPASIVIDTQAPVVVQVYSPTATSTINGNTFVVGDVIDIIVEMSLEVFIDPPPSIHPDKAPQLILNTITGGRAVLCTDYYQNNRKKLLFRYTVQAGDVSADLTYVNMNSLTLNNGQSTIKRFSTTPKTDAVLTLPAPQPLGQQFNQVLNVNTTRVPVVTSVTSPNADNILYRCGDVIEIVVTFSQHVVVQGTPFLWLDLGANSQQAPYARGSGTPQLSFLYTVQENDYSIDLEYIDHHSLDATQLNTAILHMSTNPTTSANTDLPYPFTQGSLAFSKNLQINGRKPTITTVSFATPDGTYGYSQQVIIDLTFSSCVLVNTGTQGTNIPVIKFQPNNTQSGGITRYAPYVSGSATNKLRFQYTIRTGDSSSDLDYADGASVVLNGARILTCVTTPNKAAVQDVDIHLNPPRGRLQGATQKTITFGKVIFTDLLVNQLGFGYRVAFTTQVGNAVLETSNSFDVLYSSGYGVRSSPYDSGDRMGYSVDVDGDTMILGGNGAKEPQSAVQIVTLLGDAPNFVDEVQLIQISALQRPAVQELTSSAAPGETLGGWFFVSLGALGTRRLNFDFDEVQLQVALEMDLGFGSQTIRVTRQPNTYCACSNGFIWTISFLYVEGPLAPLTTTSQLTGHLATVGDGRGSNAARILVDSTAISGFFTLQLGTSVTRNIRSDVADTDLGSIISQDLRLSVRSVTRSGPTPVLGYSWTVTFVASDTLYDVPQLVPTGAGLVGYKASCTVLTLRGGLGRLSGVFRLRFRNDIFPNDETDDISVTATDLQMQAALEKLVSINTVRVVRSTSMNAYGGYSWTITFIQVNTKNQYGPIIDTSGNLPPLVPETVITTAGVQRVLLKGTNARVDIQVGGYSLPPVLPGATHWGLPGERAGMAAVFTRGEHDWKQQGSTLTGTDTRMGDLFGSSVSLKGDIALMGAPAAAIFGDFEQQTLFCDADAGYFTLSYRGRVSNAIPFDGDQLALQTAIVKIMSVSFGDVDIPTPFVKVCGATQIRIVLRSPDHGDQSGQIPLLVPNGAALQKTAIAPSIVVSEFTAGTYRVDGIGAKGVQCGAAYFFKRVNGVWSQSQKIGPPPQEIFDVREFGAKVSIAGTFAVVGAPGAYAEQGRVYVYQYVAQGNSFVLFQILSADPFPATTGDRFGDAVAISTSAQATVTIAVGAPGYSNRAGAVFVYDLVNGAFQNRQFMLKVTPELQDGDEFGYSLDLDMVYKFTMVVGARKNALRNGKETGLAIVFVRRSAIDTFFNQQQVLYGSDSRTGDRFGHSVSVSKDTVIVGAHESYKGPQTIRKAVQYVTVDALAGVVQSGTFVLSVIQSSSVPGLSNSLQRVQTRAIPYNVDAATMRLYLEADLPLGKVLVSRDGPSATQGYTWYLTFAGFTGELGLLYADGSQLVGDSPTIVVDWVVRTPPVLRSNVYVFTRGIDGKWTEQASMFPREKQYFSWFGSAVAIDQRTAVVGAPNLDTYETGINAGGAFVFDLGWLALGFSSKTYSVVEGNDVDVTVQRCSRNGGFCAVDVSATPALFINYDTGEAYSDRNGSNMVPVTTEIGPYQKLSMLQGVPNSAGAFWASTVAGQEPYPQVPNGRWLVAAHVSSAVGRNQFYGSTDRRSLWIDAKFDYAGESDYAGSSGQLYFDTADVVQTFRVSTTSDFVVEDPDETVTLRLSLPGIWPSYDGNFWATLTIKDNGDGGVGARASLDIVAAGITRAQSLSQFSGAVSVYDDGNVAVVGAPLEQQTIPASTTPVACGGVYFYIRKSGYWQLEQQVFPAECADGMRFGAAVGIDGSLGSVRAIVGAPGSAAVYIYLRQTVTATWTQEIRLTESVATAATHNYGGTKAVGISGDVAVVGASGLESIFVYHRTMAGWGLAVRLYSSDRVVYRILQDFVQQTHRFGQAVAIHRRTIAVGAPYSDAGMFTPPQYHDRTLDKVYFGPGAAYIYFIQAQEQKIRLRTDDPLNAGSFMLSTTYRGIAGSTKYISFLATADDMKAAIQQLSVIRIVEVTRNGSVDQGFNWTVTFIGDILPVPVLLPQWKGYGCPDCDAFSSTYKADPANQMMVEEITPIGTWQFQQRVTAPDANAGDLFGASIDVHGEQVIVGAPGSGSLASTTWDFETGDLTGWLTTGTAFDSQPTYGDNSYSRINVYRFRTELNEGPGQRANHEGRYWVGSFEQRPGAGKTTAVISSCSFANDFLCKVSNYKLPSSNAAGTYQGDAPQGTMTSQPFTILGPSLSFRLGGGCDIMAIYVELLVDGKSVIKSTGRCRETMERVEWDLTPYANATAQIRVVDASSSDYWGHINFDDVRFSWNPSQTSTERAGVAYTFRRKAPTSLEPCVAMNRKLCNWEFQARLVASDKRALDRMGVDVAVDDTQGLAVIGAPGQKAYDANNTIMLGPDNHPIDSVGSVYVFKRANEIRDGKGVLLSPPKWYPKEVAKLQYPKKEASSMYGQALALDKNTLFVGAPGKSTSPLNFQSGQAYSYDINFAFVQFTSSIFYCVEGNSDGRVSLTVSRTGGDLTSSLTIGYATEDLNAKSIDVNKYAACMLIPVTLRKDCCDYQQLAGEITFAAGEVSKQIMIPVVDDTCKESWAEFFVVRLNIPGGEPLLGEKYVATVRIDDDDWMYDAC